MAIVGDGLFLCLKWKEKIINKKPSQSGDKGAFVWFFMVEFRLGKWRLGIPDLLDLDFGFVQSSTAVVCAESM